MDSQSLTSTSLNVMQIYWGKLTLKDPILIHVHLEFLKIEVQQTASIDPVQFVAEDRFILTDKTDIPFSLAFLCLCPAADLITFYIYQSSRCYFGFKTLVTDIRSYIIQSEHWGLSKAEQEYSC